MRCNFVFFFCSFRAKLPHIYFGLRSNATEKITWKGLFCIVLIQRMKGYLTAGSTAAFAQY